MTYFQTILLHQYSLGVIHILMGIIVALVGLKLYSLFNNLMLELEESKAEVHAWVEMVAYMAIFGVIALALGLAFLGSLELINPQYYAYQEFNKIMR